MLLEQNSESLSSVQSLSHVRLFEIPWTAVCQASLSIKFKFLHRQEVSNIQIHEGKILTNLIIRDNSCQIINIPVSLFLDLICIHINKMTYVILQSAF